MRDLGRALSGGACSARRKRNETVNKQPRRGKLRLRKAAASRRTPNFVKSVVKKSINHLLARCNLPFIRYLFVGGWNTLFGVGLYALVYAWLGARVNYLVLLIPCNILAITNAYFCYKLFVFRTRGNWLREYLRFYVVYGGAALIGVGLVALCVQLLHMHPVWANIVTTAVTVVCSFFGHQRISFAPRSS